MATKIPTIEQLRAPEQRRQVYNNAAKHPDGERVRALIDESGLTLSGTWMSVNDPVYREIVEIAWSAEGKAAAIDASEQGMPALCGLDHLFRERLGGKYHKHDKGTMSAGGAIAEVMRHMGYREAGTGKCPEGCIARSGIVWKKISN